jgi:hypothetical protein
MNQRRRRRGDNGEGTQETSLDIPEVEVIDPQDETSLENLPESEDLCAMVHEAPMTKAMEAVGVDKNFLAVKVKEEMEASKTIVFMDQKTGEIKYSKDLVDWNTRREGRRDAHQLLGHFPPAEHKIGVAGAIAVDLGPEGKRIAKEILGDVFCSEE